MYTERTDTLNDLHKFSLTFGVRIQFDTWLWRFFPLDLKIHSKLLQHFNSRKFFLADEDHLQNLKRFKVTSKAFMQALFTCKCFSRFTSSTTNFQRCCRRHDKTRILTNSWQLKFSIMRYTFSTDIIICALVYWQDWYGTQLTSATHNLILSISFSNSIKLNLGISWSEYNDLVNSSSLSWIIEPRNHHMTIN